MGRADEILEIAQEMIQTRGYNAFSFQDISKELGIKKASVQFYYPRKADLGREVVKRYTTLFADLLEQTKDPSLRPLDKLNLYLQPFKMVAHNEPLICLCGVLGSEFNTLPEDVQQAVAKFYDLNEKGLAKILEEGQQDGSFTFKTDSLNLSKSIFASFQGALMLGRSRKDQDYLQEVADVWFAQIGVAHPSDSSP